MLAKSGIAHFTTFSHAEKKGYAFFGMFDADDTAFCCNVEKRCELLRMAEEYARRNDLEHSPMICGGLVV